MEIVLFRTLLALTLAGFALLGAFTCGVDAARGRAFPDTTSTIGILVDQLAVDLSLAQQKFAVTHFVGTQKLSLNRSRPLRALNPNFLVLHYHLAMWQSAPATTFITDGMNWANDYPAVTSHESWFWHNAAGARVASRADAKLLMNVSDAGFRDYWARSIAAQVQAGDYDGVFLDSASPALLQGECSGSDGRLSRTAAKDRAFAELGGKTWITAWEEWIAGLEAALSSKGIALIPNVGALITTWDNTNYRLTRGIFVEGFADPGFSTADWKASTNEILAQVRAGKIVILQNYLSAAGDLNKRRYYLGNYLLVKGLRTYVDYFAGDPFQWFPEWGLDLGAPKSPAAAGVNDLARSGVYWRDFDKGVVLVNPSNSPVTVSLGATLRRVEPSGGGDIPKDGTPPGSITTTAMSSITVTARGAEILLR